MKKLLLLSNSKNHGEAYLEYCRQEINSFLGDQIKKVFFIPFAGISNFDGYEKIVKEAYKKIGYDLESIHRYRDPSTVLEEAEAIFIGGGNTFCLLNYLYHHNLLKVIKKRVEQGIPYIGVSAGSNVAAPTIKTTNDMPIVYPPSFSALELINFNINPHYLDPDPNSMHQGETREMRINEFHLLNDPPVVGLRESSYLLLQEDKLFLKGSKPARIFQKGKEAEEFVPGSELSFLL